MRVKFINPSLRTARMFYFMGIYHDDHDMKKNGHDLMISIYKDIESAKLMTKHINLNDQEKISALNTAEYLTKKDMEQIEKHLEILGIKEKVKSLG